MSDNTLAVKITADIVDLQTKFAVAKAEVNGLTSEMNKLAKASAAGTIDAAGTQRLQQFAGDLLAARQASQGYAAELEKAGFSVSTFGQKMGEGHGSISTATREFRALFDELSSGRTRQTPGTLAIIAQRVFGLGPAALGSVAGVVGLVGGLALLAAQAIKTSKSLDEAVLGAQFAGNLAIGRDAIKGFEDELKTAKGISTSEAKEITAALVSIPGISIPVLHALTAEMADFAQLTGKDAVKAAEELAKVFNAKTSAAEFARSIGGITQAQINWSEQIDRSGDAIKVQEAKLSTLIETTGRSSTTMDEQSSKVAASAKNLIAYFGVASEGTSVEEFQNGVLESNVLLRQRQLDVLKQVGVQLAATQQSPEQTLKTGVGVADKENPVARQIEEAKSKIGEMNAALAIAQARSDSVNIDKLNAGLAKANEELSNLQLGPVLERMREQIQQVAATWDGSQSGMLAKQLQVAQGTLASVQQNAKERVQVETEIARLTVQQRQAAGSESIAVARSEIAAINGETAIGAIQRLEKERDVWVQTLAGDRLTATQRLEVARSINQDIASIEKERQAQTQAIARSDADADIAIARLTLSAKRSELELEVQANQITAARKLEILRDLANQEFALNLHALQSEMDGLKNQPVEYERVYNQIRELKAKQTLELANLDRQAALDAARQAKEQVTAWRSAVNEIESVESKLVSDIIGGRKTLSQSLLQIGAELATKEITNDIKAFTTRMLLANTEEAQKKALSQAGFLYHLLFDQKKTAETVTGEAARTTAVTTGEAARTAAASAAAVTTQAELAATGPPMVMADAARAAAGAFAAIVGIPYVGPALAPAAAAEAFTAVSAFAPLAALDTGTNYIPRDMLAQLHQGEAVIPRAYNPAANESRSGGGKSGGSNTVNLHVTAIDAPSFVKWARQNSGDFAAAMKGVHSRFWLS